MNGVNSSRDVCIGNSRAAAFSSRFVWVTVTSGCAVEKMLHKEDVLGGGKLKTCKLSTLVSLLCGKTHMCRNFCFLKCSGCRGAESPSISPCGGSGTACQLPTNAVLGGVGLRLVFNYKQHSGTGEKLCMISAKLSGKHS